MSPPGLRPERWFALLGFFAPYVVLAVAAMLWTARTPVEQMGGAGMGLGYFALVLGPALPIYLVLLPFLVRGMRHLSSRTLMGFALRASILSMTGMPLAFGVYLLLSPRFPTLADRYFFLGIPAAPPLIGVLASYLWTLRRHPRPAAVVSLPEPPPVYHHPPMNASHKPAGYNTVSPYLVVEGAARTIAFLQEVFGATALRQFPGPDGKLAHAEVRIDDTVVMLADGMDGWPPVATHVHVYVSDVDATYERALAAGATSVQAPVKKDDADKRAGVQDAGGTTWWIATRVG